MLSVYSDDHFMNEAIKEAKKAFDLNEVPVGAIVVCNNRVIARAHNMVQQLNDVTAHAEMLAFTSATEYLGGKYLNECTLYVTLEPCIMCAGASFWAQLRNVVYGASDPKRGFSRLDNNILHPKCKVVHGIKETECREILIQFFEQKREKK